MFERAWTWIIIVSLTFGAGFPLSKALFESGVTVWQLFVVRNVLAAAIVLTLTRRGLADPVARRRGSILGVANVALPTLLITVATDLLPASVAGILVAFIPITTIAFAHFVVPGERFVARRVPGVVVALVGVTVLVLGSSGTDGGGLSPAGVASGLGGVVFAGLGGAINRRFGMKTDSKDLVAPQFTAMALSMSVVSAPFGGFDLGGLTPLQWIGMVVMAVVSTTVPFYGILRAYELTVAATAANIGYLVPLVASVTSIALLGDPVTLGFAAGAVLILGGVWWSDAAARAQRAAETPSGAVGRSR